MTDTRETTADARQQEEYRRVLDEARGWSLEQLTTTLTVNEAPPSYLLAARHEAARRLRDRPEVTGGQERTVQVAPEDDALSCAIAACLHVAGTFAGGVNPETERRHLGAAECLKRLRARQREGESDEWWDCPHCQLVSNPVHLTYCSQCGKRRPQRKGEREPDGWIGSCGSCRVTDLIEEWSPPDECPRCGNEDYGVRALNWHDTEPAETLTHDDVVAALEAVDWLAERASRPPVGGAPTPRRMIDYRVSVLRDALDRDTEPPAEPDLNELTPRCPACEETMHDCECNPYMGTGGDDD